MSVERVPPAFVVDGAIQVCRESHRNDGAVGESVHLVCDELARLREEVAHFETERKLDDLGWQALQLATDGLRRQGEELDRIRKELQEL